MILKKIEMNRGQYLLCAQNGETRDDLWPVLNGTHEIALETLRGNHEAEKIFLTESKKIFID